MRPSAKKRRSRDFPINISGSWFAVKANDPCFGRDTLAPDVLFVTDDLTWQDILPAMGVSPEAAKKAAITKILSTIGNVLLRIFDPFFPDCSSFGFRYEHHSRGHNLWFVEVRENRKFLDRKDVAQVVRDDGIQVEIEQIALNVRLEQSHLAPPSRPPSLDDGKELKVLGLACNAVPQPDNVFQVVLI